jgi:hypothetical protein
MALNDAEMMSSSTGLLDETQRSYAPTKASLLRYLNQTDQATL